MATMTRTSFRDSLAEWKYAPIVVRDIYSAAFEPISFFFLKSVTELTGDVECPDLTVLEEGGPGSDWPDTGRS